MNSLFIIQIYNDNYVGHVITFFHWLTEKPLVSRSFDRQGVPFIIYTRESMLW